MSTTVYSQLRAAAGATLDHTRSRLLAVEWAAGTLIELRESDLGVSVLAGGFDLPQSVAVSPDGQLVYVTERSGTLVCVPAATPQSNRRIVLSGLDMPHQLALSADGLVAYLVEFGPTGRLLEIDLAACTIRRVVSYGLGGAVGLALSQDGSQAYVTVQTPQGGVLVRVSVATGQVTPLLSGLVAPFQLSWADPASGLLLLTERHPANQVSAVSVASATPTRVVLDTVGEGPAAAVQGRIPGDIYVFCDQKIDYINARAGLLPNVSFEMPASPLFVGSYVRIPYQLSGFGVSAENLAFEVDGGPSAGLVSLAPEGKEPFLRLLLIAGAVTGSFALVARDSRNSAELGRGRFEVTTEWTEVDGPSLAFGGVSDILASGSAWGGGPSGPQNAGVYPGHVNTRRRVAVLLVDLAAQRFTGAEATAAATTWAAELASTTTPSTARYFQEVSFGRFGIDLVGGTVHGPFHLSGTWSSRFDQDNLAKNEFIQAAITAAQGTVNFDLADSVLVVCRSVTPAGGPVTFAWPCASSGIFTYQAWAPMFGMLQKGIAWVSMPHDWPAQNPPRLIRETAAHELSHNLGLADQYMPAKDFGAEMAARELTTYELMAWEESLPHLSLPHRLMLGWMSPNDIRCYNFSGQTGIDHLIDIQAAELAGPGTVPAGRCAGVEVRIADGRNYYLEYRRNQAGHVGDGNVNMVAGRVVGSDVVSSGHKAATKRRGIIGLRDAQADGPGLATGAVYDDMDYSVPAGFDVQVVSVAADHARIRLRYGTFGKPDLSIRPHPGGDDWQSPDIRVENDWTRSRLNEPDEQNRPWAGHINTIRATVRNLGDFPANSVTVNFWVKDASVTGHPEQHLGTNIRNVGANSSEVFTTTWIPPETGHYCVVVRIANYTDPGNATIHETTDTNNMAQSNYSSLVSEDASPARREVSSVSLHNEYPGRMRYTLAIRKHSEHFRVFLERRSVVLEPGETRVVPVMFESLVGNNAGLYPALGDAEAVYANPDNISIIGLATPVGERRDDAPEITGGCQFRLSGARRTEMDAPLLTSSTTIAGHVWRYGDPSTAPPDGTIVLVLLRSDDRVADEVVLRAVLQQGGYSVPIQAPVAAYWPGAAGEVTSRAYYLGSTGWAPCESPITTLGVAAPASGEGPEPVADREEPALGGSPAQTPDGTPTA